MDIHIMLIYFLILPFNGYNLQNYDYDDEDDDDDSFNIVISNKPDKTPNENIDSTTPTSSFPPLKPDLEGDLLVLDVNRSALPIFQSKQCSQIEIQRKVQCFTIVPKNEYNVLVHDDVTIPCIVSNQHGKVQWRAKSYVLGYDRSVPGMPRMTIIGDATKGEHNLRIKKLKIEDSGEYECQVQPVDKHPILRRRSVINVLVPPAHPIIYFNNQPIKDSKSIIIQRPESASSLSAPRNYLELFCQSSDLMNQGIPESEFLWFWNTRQLRNSKDRRIEMTSLKQTKKTKDNIFIINRSRLKITMNILKSGDKIRCLVGNQATRILERRQQMYFRDDFEATIVVLVYDKPGIPILNDLSNQKPPSYQATNQNRQKQIQNHPGIREWDKITLKCSANPAGIPSAQIHWFITNLLTQKTYLLVDYPAPSMSHLQKDGVAANLSVSITTNQIMYNDNNNNNANNNQVQSILILSNITRYLHNSNVFCRVKHPLLTRESDKYKLLIKYSPYHLYINTFQPLHTSIPQSSLTISTHSSQISGMEDSDIQVICKTSDYFGTIKLSWLIEENGSETLLDPNKQMYANGDQIDKEKVTMISYVTKQLKLTRNYINQFLVCRYEFENGERVLDVKSQFNIFYPPRISIISGYVNQYPVQEDDTIQLTCCTYGGNPQPILRWYKSNNQTLLLQSKHSNSNSKYVNQQEQNLPLRIIVTRKINAQQLFCTAQSAGSVVRSRSISINVIFPAENITLTCLNCNPDKLSLRETVTFLCESSSSNPDSIIKWSLINCTNQCVSTEIKGAIPTKIPSSYRGWKTQSSLQLPIEFSYHSQYLQCRAQFSSNMLQVQMYKSRTAMLKLSVITKPIIRQKHQYLWPINVTEGRSFYIKPSIIANPSLSNIRWSHNGQLITNNLTLCLTTPSKKTTGYYNLEVFNKLGKDSVAIFINVVYPPVLLEKSLKGTNQSFILKTVLSLNPFDPEQVYYQKLIIVDRLRNQLSQRSVKVYCNNYSRTNKPRSNLNKLSCHYYPNHTLHMTYNISNNLLNQGYYQVHVNNGVGNTILELFRIFIPSAPQSIKVRHFSITGTAPYHPTNLTCCFRSNQNLTSIQLVRIQPMKSKNQQYTSEQIDRIHKVSENVYCGYMSIKTRLERDNGRYYCSASNKIGQSNSSQMILRNYFTPEFPKNFSVLVHSNRSVQFFWIQGAFGAPGMFFKVKWRLLQTSKSKKTKDSPQKYYEKIVNCDKWREIVKLYISGSTDSAQSNSRLRKRELTSGLMPGNYESEIGVGNSQFPTIRFCCLIRFTVNLDTKTSHKRSKTSSTNNSKNHNSSSSNAPGNTPNNFPLLPDQYSTTSFLIILLIILSILLLSIIITISFCSIKYRKTTTTATNNTQQTSTQHTTDKCCCCFFLSNSNSSSMRPSNSTSNCIINNDDNNNPDGFVNGNNPNLIQSPVSYLKYNESDSSMDVDYQKQEMLKLDCLVVDKDVILPRNDEADLSNITKFLTNNSSPNPCALHDQSRPLLTISPETFITQSYSNDNLVQTNSTNTNLFCHPTNSLTYSRINTSVLPQTLFIHSWQPCVTSDTNNSSTSPSLPTPNTSITDCILNSQYFLH